jgi:hypothetical protein
MKTVRFVSRLALALAFVFTLAPLAQAQCPVALTGPFCIDGTITDADNSGVAGALKVIDPAGSTSELSAINGSDYQIGVINRVLVPPGKVLGFTSQPPKVDLNAVWTQVKMDGNGHQWFYFAWSRDSAQGSGFISIEMQHAAAPATCDYSGVDQTSATSSANLIANCNPWQNRQAGDFLILWDQQGNNLVITKRVFTGSGSNLTLDPTIVTLGTAKAAYSPDNFRGEVAIDLTTDVFDGVQSCTSIANMLPNTLTGNSDTADYKDTVLANFPPISNCGSVDVTKYTQDPSGTRFSGTGTFPYTLARSGGANLRYAADVNPGDSLTQVTGTLTSDGDKDTILNLIADGTANYTLVEDTATMGAQWTLVSIACTVGDGTVSPYLTTSYPSGSIPVVIGEITHCVITNKYVLASPSALTTPSASYRLFDFADFSGIVNLGTLPTQATFYLYSDVGCTQQVTGSPVTATLTYANNNTTATASTGTTGILVLPGTYYWRVSFPGNTFNSSFLSSCGSEIVTVNAISVSGTGVK